MPPHRLTIRLDAERRHRLLAEAARRGVSPTAVVRDALDRALPPTDDERRAALAAILAADPMPVPLDPTDLKREIAAIRPLAQVVATARRS